MGIFIGDGGTHNNNYVISTSSKQFANDIRTISLRIGYPFYIYKQENHQGCGIHPIYRIYYNPSNIENRDYGYDGLSATAIKYIEDLPSQHVYDFTVEGTSTFFFKNGLCCHQCDDFATRLLGQFTVPKWTGACIGILMIGYNDKESGHALNIFMDVNKKLWIIEPQSDAITSLHVYMKKHNAYPYLALFI
jgi:hypothetical protein